MVKFGGCVSPKALKNMPCPWYAEQSFVKNKSNFSPFLMEIKARKEIYGHISSYLLNNLSIQNEGFSKIILNAYLENQTDMLESLLEPEHLKNLNRKILPIMKIFGAENEEDSVSAKGGTPKRDLMRSPPSANRKTQPACHRQKYDRTDVQRKRTEGRPGSAEALERTSGVLDLLSDDRQKKHLCDSDYTEDCDTDEDLGFPFKDLPETLIPKEETQRQSAGLRSFIYKIEHPQADDEEETVEDKIDEIRHALSENPVVLVQGNTGCGKTTKIPRLLLSDFGRIVCTQPRRLAAMSVARKVASDVGSALGDLVGYTIRFDDKTSKNTRLRFVTDGILLKELSSLQGGKCGKKSQKQKSTVGAGRDVQNTRPPEGACGAGKERENGDTVNLDGARSIKIADGKNTGGSFASNTQDGAKYDLIIIDEAHERTVNMDFLMGYFKTLKNTKLLIMSATLDSEKFIGYFNCPFIEMKHKMHKIDYFYLRSKTSNYFKSALQTVAGILNGHDSGDVLVFLTGQEEIENGYTLLSDHYSGADVKILKLYSAMSSEEQDKIFQKGTRKVILSTNIAETSITIENVKFVVDCGKVKRMRRSSEASIDFLETVSISKAQARQRAGRAGRTAPGSVYRIYTHDEFLEMEENSMPEILRFNLSGVVLSLKALGINDVVNFDFIDRPPIDNIRYSLCFLYYLKAIDKYGEITPLGKRLVGLPLEPEMAMSLLTAKRLGCLDAVSTIAAFLNSVPIFIELKMDNQALKKAQKKFQHPKGDFYSFLLIFDSWKRSNFSFEFLKKNYLKPKTMMQILKIKLQLMNYPTNRSFSALKRAATDIHSRDPADDGENLIEKSFCSGFFMNIAKKSESGYSTIFGALKCHIHPNDGLFKSHAKYVLFFEIVCIKKEYMRMCLAVDSKTLSEACNFEC